MYILTPKTILSSRNPDKHVDDHVDDDLLKLINSIIKDAQEGNWSHFSWHSELPRISSHLADESFSNHSESPFCQILPALMTVTTNHLLCQ